jgi:hypothetical protein
MSTVVVELPDDIAARLAAASKERHVSASDVVREALEKTLPDLPADFQEDTRPLYDRMKDAIGCIDSGISDLATNKKYMEGYGRNPR